MFHSGFPFVLFGGLVQVPDPRTFPHLSSMFSFSRAWLELDLPRHKAEFYNAWHLGQQAGLSHARILETMGDFKRSATVARLRDEFLEGARGRKTLDYTVGTNPTLLTPFEAGSLRLGEESGRLEQVLKFLSDYFSAEFRAVQKVKRLLAQPMITAVAAVFIVAFPVLYYGNPTGYLITVGLEVAVLLFGGGVLVRSVAGRYRKRREFVLGRLCRALAMGVEAGLPIAAVAEFAVAAADHTELSAHVAGIPRRERGRQPLAQTFAGCRLLPFELIASLEVADATGNYNDTLVKLAGIYDGGFARGAGGLSG